MATSQLERNKGANKQLKEQQRKYAPQQAYTKGSVSPAIARETKQQTQARLGVKGSIRQNTREESKQQKQARFKVVGSMKQNTREESKQQKQDRFKVVGSIRQTDNQKIKTQGTAGDLDTKARRGGFTPITSKSLSQKGTGEASAEEAKVEASSDKASDDNAVTTKIKNVGKKISKGFKKIITAITQFIASIPATLVVIKLVSIVLICAIVVNLLYSLLTSLANMLLETTVAEATLLNWTNPYLESLKTQEYLEEDGTYRTLIKKVYETGNNDDDDNPDPPSPVNPTDPIKPTDPSVYTDVDLWCRLTDDQIEAFILSKGSQYSDLDNYCYTFNIFRIIRMAYRICYATDADGKRFIQCEPEVLLGVPQFEKGFEWLNYQSKKQKYSSTTYNWYSKGTSGYTAVSTSLTNKTDVRNKCNVDNCYSDAFDTSTWLDGPYSFTNADMSTCRTMFKTDFAAAVGKGSSYNALYKALVDGTETFSEADDYNEYSFCKDFLAIDGTTVNDPNDCFMNFMFPAMLLTAVNFDANYYKTKVPDTYDTNTSTYFWETVAPLIADGVISETSDLGSKYSYDIMFFLFAMHYRITDVVKSSDLDSDMHNLYAAYRRQCIMALYYNYHHLPNFQNVYSGVVFDTSPLTTNADGKYAGEDWYACQLYLTFESVYLAGGNLANLSNNDYIGNPKDISALNSTWLPRNDADVMTAYKGGVGGEWMSYYDYKNGKAYYEDDVNYAYEVHGYYDNGVDDLKDMISQGTYYGSAYTPFYNSSSSKSLPSSLWYAVQEQSTWLDAIDKNLAPLSIASNFYKGYSYQYGNLHAFSVEGLMAYICGSDLQESCLNAILTNSGSSDKPSDDDPTAGEVNGLIYGNTLSKILGSDTQSKMSAVSMNGVAAKYAIDAASGNVKYTGTNNTIFPLADCNNTVEGIQSGNGNNLYLSSASGYYYVNGVLTTHAGLDIGGVGNSQTIINIYSNATQDFWFNGDLDDVVTKIEAQSSDVTPLDVYAGCRTPVVAMADGYITKIVFGYYSTCGNTEWVTGNTVVMSHCVRKNMVSDITQQSLDYTYGHISPDSMAVLADSLGMSVSDLVSGAEAKESSASGYTSTGYSYTKTFSTPLFVKKGTILGYADNTGSSYGAHLHWGTNSMRGNPNGTVDGLPNGSLECLIFFGKLCYGVDISDNSVATKSNKYIRYPFSEDWCSACKDTGLASKLGINPMTGYYTWDLKNLIAMVKKAGVG